MSEEVEVDIDEVVHETQDAYLVMIDGETHWMSKSTVKIEGNIMTCSEYIANAKGLI